MLPWHLLHSNSLWGPVNQVPSLPGGILEMQTLQSCHFWDLNWNYRHLSQLLRARRVLCSTPSLACPPSGTNQKTRLWLKWEPHSTSEPKSSSASLWHGTEPSEQRCDLKIGSCEVQSVTRGTSDTLWTCTVLHWARSSARRWPCQWAHRTPGTSRDLALFSHVSPGLASSLSSHCTSFLQYFLPISIAPMFCVVGPTRVHISQRNVFYNLTTVQRSNWKRS